MYEVEAFSADSAGGNWVERFLNITPILYTGFRIKKK